MFGCLGCFCRWCETVVHHLQGLTSHPWLQKVFIPEESNASIQCLSYFVDNVGSIFWISDLFGVFQWYVDIVYGRTNELVLFNKNLTIYKKCDKKQFLMRSPNRISHIHQFPSSVSFFMRKFWPARQCTCVFSDVPLCFRWGFRRSWFCIVTCGHKPQASKFALGLKGHPPNPKRPCQLGIPRSGCVEQIGLGESKGSLMCGKGLLRLPTTWPPQPVFQIWRDLVVWERLIYMLHIIVYLLYLIHMIHWCRVYIYMYI